MFEKYKIILTVEGSTQQEISRILADLAIDIQMDEFKRPHKFTRETEEAELKGKFMIIEDTQ